MIRFNVPPVAGKEFEYIKQAIESKHICGDGDFTKKCNKWIEQTTGCKKALLTTSCTHALEMAALMCDFQLGDEVILPSYTFSSSANCFIPAGATLVFVDVDPKTMNIDPDCIEKAITDKTKAICVMHYAGVACDMDRIMDIAHKHNLIVIEDAAQAVMATYKGKALGTFGTFGCFSFHETKNYSMGEGGALLINDEAYIEKAEILREKGTDRSKFFRGQVDKYSWRDFGSSYLPSELNAAYLWAQLEIADEINQNRLDSWNRYYEALKPLAEEGKIELQKHPEGTQHNAHMFYIKLRNLEERTRFIEHMKANDILTVFHYVPLHSAPAGLKYGRFAGEDVYTTAESDRLVRLPLYYKLDKNDREKVIKTILDFWKE